MIDPYEKNRKLGLLNPDIDDTGESGESGGQGGSQGGALEFQDFLKPRGEQYTAEEVRQHLATHRDTNGSLIEKQKKLREQRNEKKEGREVKQQYGAAQQARGENFLRHPILSEKAEFDGVDPQVNLDPTIYEAETNSEKKEELTYQHQLRLGLQNQPRFNPPKPSPF